MSGLKKNSLFFKVIIGLIVLSVVIMGIVFIDTDKNEKNNDYVKISALNNEEKKKLDNAIEVETEYCTLYYPSEYKENLEVEYSDNSGYKAGFYGKVDGKEAVHLFDICFNSDEGSLLGYLDFDKEAVNMSFEVNELSFDDSWKQKDIDKMYAMQEEVNFVLAALGTNDNYVEP